MASTGLPKFTEELRSATLDFVKSKGMPVVEDMFRRRIGEQPLATLNPQKQKNILQEAQEEAAEEKIEEEEAEEEAKWRKAVLFDANKDENNNVNNDNLERIGLTDGRADVMLTRMSKEVDSSFRLARVGGDAKEEAAVVAEADEVIVAPAAAMAAAAAAKGEELADLIEIAEAVAKGEEAAADLVEIVEIAAAAAKSEEAAADVVEMVDIEKKDPDVVERPDLTAVKDLSAKVDPDEEVLMFGLVEGENGRRDEGAEEDPSSRSLPDLDDIPIRHCVVAADNDDNDVDGRAAAATTATSMAPRLNANNSRAAETDSYPAEPITSTAHSLSAVDEAQPLSPPLSSPPPTMLTPLSHWDVVVASLDVLSSTSLRQNQKGLSPTLRDLVWELSSSSSDSVFSLQGRDYPGIHAYNRAYLTSRSGVVFRGVDAFCAVH